MPVSEQTPVNSSTGNGVTTVFPYTFKILNQTDIEVTVDGVVQTLTTHYSVSGVGVDGGGNVTFVSAPANATTVVRVRNMAINREIDYQENGDLPAVTLDEDIDRTVMLIQQINAGMLRAVKMPEGETTDQVLAEGAAGRANKLLGFDSGGNVVTMSAIDVGITPVTSFAETLLDDSTAAEARETLGFKASADIASAATIDLSAATGNVVRVSGTTTSTAATMNAGQVQVVTAEGAWPLTYHATTMRLITGADYTCTAEEPVLFYKDLDNVVHVWPAKASVKLAGDVVQVIEATPYTTNSSTATTIPADDTIPQNTEGAEWNTVTITPANSSNRLRIEVFASVVSGSSIAAAIGALFQDSTANALAVVDSMMDVVGHQTSLYLFHEMAAGTTSATTFKFRAGASTGTLYINGGAGRLFGGIAAIRMSVTEIKV